MPIYETFSKRIKRIASAGQTEIYQYDDLPIPFRHQVLHIWRDSLGGYHVPREHYHARFGIKRVLGSYPQHNRTGSW